MKETEREAYTKYLTERLDSGESKNIVVPTVVEQILQKIKEVDRVRVLDIGCFSGAMLDRIRRETPETIRDQVDFCGVDMDEVALELGRNKYPNLTLFHGEVHEEFNQLGQFNIIILSNVIHEAILEGESVERAVSDVVEGIVDLLSPDGSLVILDGLRPENNQTKVKIEFSSEEQSQLFKLFVQEYLAFPIEAEESSNGSFDIRLKDLAAFLTKARYLREDYWPVEATQLYQFFSADQFIKVLEQNGLRVEKLEPQLFDQQHIDNIFTKITPEIEIPAKNVLIVAKKVSD